MTPEEKTITLISTNHGDALVLQTIFYEGVRVRYAENLEKGLKIFKSLEAASSLALIEYGFIKNNLNFIQEIKKWVRKVVVYFPIEEEQVHRQSVLNEGADSVLELRILEDEKIRKVLLNAWSN